MASEVLDARMTSIKPRIRYNTIGGVNGPLVILEDVCLCLAPDELAAFGVVLAGQLTVCVLRSNSPGIMKLYP